MAREEDEEIVRGYSSHCSTLQASSKPANRTVSGSALCFGKLSLAGDEGLRVNTSYNNRASVQVRMVEVQKWMIIRLNSTNAVWLNV